jgi:probable F420-dependent oxidoreductase
LSTTELGRVGVWTFSLDLQPVAAAQEAAAELESLGYGAIWLPEAVGRDPLVHAGLLLEATSTITLATGIAGIYSRDAMTMRAGQCTLEEAFPGRFLLGLGVSHQPMVEAVRGHTYDKPLVAMRRYLDAMDTAIYVAAAPTSEPRRVLAALGPKMLALAAERAAGAHPYLVPVDHTPIARKVLGEGPLLCPEQAVVLSTDPAEARKVARQHLSIYLGLPNYSNNWRRLGFGDDDLADGGSDRFVDSLVAWGSVDDILTRVRAHLDAGADHVAIQVLPTDPRALPMDAWRELAPALTSLGSGAGRGTG